MKIAILGTRGIPNNHGGFEQFAEYFSTFLVENGHEVVVYNSSLHPYKQNQFKGVNLIHCQDPENKIGTIGQFIYDLNCIVDSRKRNFDVILQLGYTSSSIWYFLLPKRPKIITNMDGLEWKRTKYSSKVRKFLKFAEKLAINHSDFLISDSIGIQNYIQEKYKKNSEFIAYGATVFENQDLTKISKFKLQPYQYNLLIARMEPENNIEMVIKGTLLSKDIKPLLIIGNYQNTEFGKYLFAQYGNIEKIKFIGGVYDIDILNNLRYFSNLYFHGHSVGGTNPSLLEAMACNCLIAAHNNIFNGSVLEKDAEYFSDEQQVKEIIDKINKDNFKHRLDNNMKKIKQRYAWDIINSKYLEYIEKCLEE